MKKRRQRESSLAGRTSAHLEHLDAHTDHALWLRELERWRSEHQQAIVRFAHRLLPELELGSFQDALDRHEAAILAHEELVDRHEQRIRREKSGEEQHSEEADALHEQVHDRHELSRRQHEQLARAHQAILRAMAMYESESNE